jgi:hypothetical protein
MSLPRRLRRHLSYANVIASLALFAALSGSAYAASQINGNSIVKHSIGGGKLKNETITSKQIKKNSLNSSVIDLSTLATVPSAQTAVTATSANSATTANTANSATTATKADSAETANKANSATSADHATSAGSAEHATSADSATNANHAATAGDAETLGAKTAAELTDACPAETEPFGGMCWDEAEQQARGWIPAAQECAAREGRLPTISELVAYVLRPANQVSGENWSADVSDIVAGNKEIVLTSDETTRRAVDSTAGITLRYRCLFYRTNNG